MVWRVQFQRDHRPAFAKGRGEDAAVAGEGFGVLQNAALVLCAGHDPGAAAVAGVDGGVEDARTLMDDSGCRLGIAIGRWLHAGGGEKAEIADHFGRDMGRNRAGCQRFHE
jgi:hypothetical protein